MAGFKDEDKERTKRVLINELELELKICREKIDDARSAGDKNAKYQLTRVENSIEQEIKRLKYDLPAKVFHNDKSVFDK
jgi:sialic acid synthase SpsE